MATKKNYGWIIFACFILIFLSVRAFCSQPSDQNVLDPHHKYFVSQLREDFFILRSALEEGHAGLYRYTPKEELDKHFDSIYTELNAPLTESEFLRLLTPLIAHIHDGHTRITRSESFENYSRNLPILFPFNIRIIKNKVYIFRNYSQNADIPRGSEILSINNRPISEIIKQMLPYVPHDALIQTSRFRRRLESTPNFGNLYNLLYGETYSYSLTYQEFGSHTKKTVTVQGVRDADLGSIYTKRYPQAAADKTPIQLEYKGNIAILTIRTFSSGPYRRAKISYSDFLKKAFQEFEDKGISNLIIDLRNNGGGDDAYGKILFSHLMDKPYKYYEHLRINKKEFQFLEYTNIPPEERKRADRMFKENNEGTYDLTFHPNLGEQNPIPPVFMDKVYVLINGGSFSSTGECTSLMHFHKKAVFIGEECDSGYYGNTSGSMPLLTLPNTKIRIRIPLIRYTMAVSGYAKDRGIIPEYPVSPTIEDLLKGKDTVLEFTIQVIKKKSH